jgi:flagellar hook-associated protein 3 FlgL
MTLRVSTSQYIDSFTYQITKSRSRLEETRNQIATGLRVVNPSDDSGRSGTIVHLQGLLQRIDSHKTRISFAKSYLEVQEDTVSSASQIMIRAEELASQAANGSTSASVRAQIADEIFELRESLVALANTQYQGAYVYGGLSEGDTPFDVNQTFFPTPTGSSYPAANRHYVLDPVATNPGQDTTRTISISDTETIRINSTARSVFLDSVNSLEVLGRALVGVRTDLIDADSDGAVDDPDPAGTHTAFNLPTEYGLQTQAILNSLNSLKSARVNNLQTEISSIGARVNRLDQTTQILDTLKLSTETSRSKVQDADIFEASTLFSNLQTSLEGLLASGSRISSLSLLDYL